MKPGFFIARNSNDSFFLCVSGFEYTFVNIASSGLDLGLIRERAYDERDNRCTTGFNNELNGLCPPDVQ